MNKWLIIHLFLYLVLIGISTSFYLQYSYYKNLSAEHEQLRDSSMKMVDIANEVNHKVYENSNIDIERYNKCVDGTLTAEESKKYNELHDQNSLEIERLGKEFASIREERKVTIKGFQYHELNYIDDE